MADREDRVPCLVGGVYVDDDDCAAYMSVCSLQAQLGLGLGSLLSTAECEPINARNSLEAELYHSPDKSSVVERPLSLLKRIW